MGRANLLAEFSQKQYMEDVAQIMAVRARGPQPMAFVHTYGCQQNVADGEKIKGQLEEMGFGFTDDVNEADFILFNTCAIRELCRRAGAPAAASC